MADAHAEIAGADRQPKVDLRGVSSQPRQAQLMITTDRISVPLPARTFVRFTYDKGHVQATDSTRFATLYVFHAQISKAPPCHELPRDGASWQTGVAPETGTRGQSSRSLKRKANTAFRCEPQGSKDGDKEGDSEEENERRPNGQNNKPRTAQLQLQPRIFACQFYKFAPRRYSRCACKQLKSIDHLKQHLKRTHLSSELHCDRCWRTDFGGDQDALRHHT